MTKKELIKALLANTLDDDTPIRTSDNLDILSLAVELGMDGVVAIFLEDDGDADEG